MSGQTIADIFGENSDRRVAATGWIGDHPGDGSGVAHLLIYPTGHGVAAKMRQLAAALGLPGALDGPAVTTDRVAITLDESETTPQVQLRVPADHMLILERPVTAEWVAAARRRGDVMLSVGQDGHSGRPAELETYLSRGHRLAMALAPVVTPEQLSASKAVRAGGGDVPASARLVAVLVQLGEELAHAPAVPARRQRQGQRDQLARDLAIERPRGHPDRARRDRGGNERLDLAGYLAGRRPPLTSRVSVRRGSIPFPHLT